MLFEVGVRRSIKSGNECECDVNLSYFDFGKGNVDLNY